MSVADCLRLEVGSHENGAEAVKIEGYLSPA